MFSNEDYIMWGQKLFEKAKKINRYELAHKSKVVQIIENINKKYHLSNDSSNDYTEVKFRSFMMKGSFPGPGEVKDYWLSYIVKYPYSFQYSKWENSIREIIENKFLQIIDKFNENDFYDNGEFKLTYPGDSNKNLNICIPYSLNYFQVEFAIQVIEKITKSKVAKISLWYFTHDIFFTDMYSEVIIAIDDNVNKHNDLPFISKENFLNFKFSSFENWYREIPEFKNYIDQIDINTSQCQTCGDSIYEPGGANWWCIRCEHLIDKEGNYISDECQTWEIIDSNENSDDEKVLPECKTCVNSNDVRDSGGSYWRCEHCDHTIDQEGNCVSDECEACDKSALNDENGPFYLFFDTETTGVPNDWKAPITNFDNWPRIVQLAWLVYDSQGNQISKNEYIIKPNGFEIPSDASNVHGITTEFALKIGESIEEVLLKFEQHCKKSKYLIAHNINFDSKVIGSEYLRILSRNPIYNLEHLCTMESSINFCKIPGNYGYKWPKLSELHIKLFGVDFEGAHDALADIEATAKCYWKMKKLNLI